MSAGRRRTSGSGNPLTVQFWLWGQDVLSGDLVGYGFYKVPRPSVRGSSIYRMRGVGLHSSAAWLETLEGVTVYVRGREGFLWLESPDGLPELPRLGNRHNAPQELEFSVGLARFQPFVSAYEAWIYKRHGPKHRWKQLQHLPRAAQRCRPAWEIWMRPAALELGFRQDPDAKVLDELVRLL